MNTRKSGREDFDRENIRESGDMIIDGEMVCCGEES